MGMTNEWYVSFHGGEEKTSLNNIHVYSRNGSHVRKALNKESVPVGIELRELRGFTFGPDGNLYVVNAYFDYSEVLKFKGTLSRNRQHDFVGVFAKRDKHSNPGLFHPFNVTFDSDSNLYVSNQNSQIVSRYYGVKSPLTLQGSPMPMPDGLGHAKGLPPGTFVPSARDSGEGLVEVREAVFGPDGKLYVADRGADCLKVYDGHSGKFLHTIGAGTGLVDNPIHLLFANNGKSLFIGSGRTNSVLEYDLERDTLDTFVPPNAGGLVAPAGMAFGQDGWFYVASRESKQILRYRDKAGTPDSKPFIDKLPDNPEFLMMVAG